MTLLELVQKTKDGGEFKVNTQNKTWQTICSEQQILGVPICPVSVLQHLIFKAIDAVQYGAGHKGGVYIMERLETQAPVPDKPEHGLMLTINCNTSAQLWTFAFKSASSSSYHYASGTVSTGDKNSEEEFARFPEACGYYSHPKHLKRHGSGYTQRQGSLEESGRSVPCSGSSTAYQSSFRQRQ